jgi:hypothetical protein
MSTRHGQLDAPHRETAEQPAERLVAAIH